MSLNYLNPKYVQINTKDLKSTEQLVLWSIRTWVMGLLQRQCVLAELYHAYDYYSASSAAIDLDLFMRSLTKGACRDMDIRCPLSGHISPDELTFLNILNGYQSGNSEISDIMLLSIQTEKQMEKTKIKIQNFVENIKTQGRIFLSPHSVQPPIESENFNFQPNNHYPRLAGRG